jgi:hypothetical protein
LVVQACWSFIVGAPLPRVYAGGRNERSGGGLLTGRKADCVLRNSVRARRTVQLWAGKRLLKLLREELCRDKRLSKHLGADLTAPGRPAITGRGRSSVWDFIPITHSYRAKNHTQYLHLTLDILENRVAAYVTIPNGIKSRLRSTLLGSNLEGFESLIQTVTTNMVKSLKGVEGFVPEVVVVQRHFRSQSSPGVIDCELKFDGRTALPKTSRYRGRVKSQPQWVKAAHDALAHRQSNLEFQIGCSFPYDTCPTTCDKTIVRAITDVWLACAPIVQGATE